MIIKNPWNHHLDNSRAGSKQKKNIYMLENYVASFFSFLFGYPSSRHLRKHKDSPQGSLWRPKKMDFPKIPRVGGVPTHKKYPCFKRENFGGGGGLNLILRPIRLFYPKVLLQL